MKEIIMPVVTLDEVKDVGGCIHCGLTLMSLVYTVKVGSLTIRLCPICMLGTVTAITHIAHQQIVKAGGLPDPAHTLN